MCVRVGGSFRRHVSSCTRARPYDLYHENGTVNVSGKCLCGCSLDGGDVIIYTCMNTRYTFGLYWFWIGQMTAFLPSELESELTREIRFFILFLFLVFQFEPTELVEGALTIRLCCHNGASDNHCRL